MNWRHKPHVRLLTSYQVGSRVWRPWTFCDPYVLFLFTARINRSLGQGNIFRSVCQEFYPQERGAFFLYFWDTTDNCPRGPVQVYPPHPRHQACLPPWAKKAPPCTRHPSGIHPSRPGRHPSPPHQAEHAGRHGQQVAGMHPTGMQSWSLQIILRQGVIERTVMWLYLPNITTTVASSCLTQTRVKILDLELQRVFPRISLCTVNVSCEFSLNLNIVKL